MTFDIEEKVEPQDVNLSSFKIKNSLNGKLWKNDRINQKYRRALLKIARDFLEDIEVGWVNPVDIIVTGSVANYNWDENYSDIDLHIVLDFEKVDKKKEFVEKYFKYAKDEWNGVHSLLKVGGFPVEVYVQDINQEHSSQGIYSILNDKWIEKPSIEKMDNGRFNDEKISARVAEFMNKIDEVSDEFDEMDAMPDYSEEKSKLAEEIHDKAKKIFGDIKNYRRSSANVKPFEMSTGNLTFKTLRRNGYIEKILSIKRISYDIMMSEM